MRILVLAAALAASFPVMADEGMWTFDNFPSATVQKTYGEMLSRELLDRVRLSTVRLTNCTASFVSASGLMLTNHHCVESCLAELSSKDKSLLDQGYAVASIKDERRCAMQIADVLQSTEDITTTVANAVRGQTDTAANEARKRVLTELEQACELSSVKAKTGKLTCQAVTLYEGGQYFLYKYKRYDDVRMVFAPEAGIAGFGGDPDNFQFPRWSLDFSLLRAYENGRPAKTPNHLQIDFKGPREGELVFVAGHPGTTQRLETMAQLKFERDVSLPSTLFRLVELRGRYIQFGRTTPADEQLVEAQLNGVENTIKVRRKQLDALHDDEMLDRKRAVEMELRTSSSLVGSDPWNDIETATVRERALYLPYSYIEGAQGFNSILFRFARLLVRGADERLKPNPERLREYTEAMLPRIEQQLYARVPVYAEAEVLTLSFSLQRMREWLGPDNPVIRTLLTHDSPESLAVRLVAETKLDDPAVRKQLWTGGKALVDASHDPMIELARSLDPESRALRKQFDDEVEAPVSAASERIAAARFKTYGTRVYPDATFTLRLNYGTVAGWMENGRAVPPFTFLGRAFERATGAAPFAIPESWLRVKDQLDLQTPFCISTTNDIVGGNSGSPLIDSRGRVVGLMFDGNIDSIAGNYWFNPANDRAIALHTAIIREALGKVYKAQALLDEMGQS